MTAANILPPGYRMDWGGQFELQQAANRRLSIVIPKEKEEEALALARGAGNHREAVELLRTPGLLSDSLQALAELSVHRTH